MSEVKFACPVCGQHITCDSAKSGTHMPCPTCYRELVVPQASAGNGGKLILTATEVQSRPVPSTPVGALEPPAAMKRTATPAVLLVLFLVTVGAAAYVFREKLFHRPTGETTHSEESPASTHAAAPVHLKLAPSDADQDWTLDLAAVQLADLPASGRVHGFSFALDRATITGGTLQLRQGPKWPPDLGVTINLFAERGEDLAGKTINIEATRAESPKVTLRWKNEQGSPLTETVRGSYALRLEFGAVTNKSLPGRLYLATQDAGKSFLNGNFMAEIRKPSPPKK
jgi:hypothetical protein